MNPELRSLLYMVLPPIAAFIGAWLIFGQKRRKKEPELSTEPELSSYGPSIRGHEEKAIQYRKTFYDVLEIVTEMPADNPDAVTIADLRKFLGEYFMEAE